MFSTTATHMNDYNLINNMTPVKLGFRDTPLMLRCHRVPDDCVYVASPNLEFDGKQQLRNAFKQTRSENVFFRPITSSVKALWKKSSVYINHTACD